MKFLSDNSNIIDGNLGVDLVIYENNIEKYKIKKISSNEIHVISKKNKNIKDILLNIEFIKFKNKKINTKKLN